MAKVLMVGHFSPDVDILEKGSSVAGSQVQRQILEELVASEGERNVLCCAMKSLPHWPKGPLIARELQEGNTKFLFYLNIPVLKHIFFSLMLLFESFRFKPNVCLQYNSFVFENLALLLFRFFSERVSLAVLIQDVHAGSTAKLFSKKWFRSLSERVSLSLARRFDLIVPISQAIINDFRFCSEKCFVFQGGVTKFAFDLMSRDCGNLEEMGIFAGALESHNGVDKLVRQWIEQDIQYPLHVFGRGSLENEISAMAQNSQWVFFHGLVSEAEVARWQARALWNFCLRYSIGLNQRYFFPSKFFNIAAAPGGVVVNDLYGLPDVLKSHLSILDEDLLQLKSGLDLARRLGSAEMVRERHSVLREFYSWHACVSEVLNRLSSMNRCDS